MIKKACMAILLVLLGAMAIVAHAAEALLGPGDMIKVSVFNNPELLLETRIGDGGKISFPLLGEVVIGGLTPTVAEAKIADLLSKKKLIRNPQVTIVVTLMQSQQISVLGQVNHPGRYPLDGVHSLADIIALAGGVSPDGSDEVSLIHNNDGKQVKESINIVALLRGTGTERNPTLSGGDVVFVERAPRFYIYGEVQHPGSYKLEPNMNVLQALSLGGGLTPRGTERGVRIKRRDAQGALQILDVKGDDLVKVDDIVYIKESLF